MSESSLASLALAGFVDALNAEIGGCYAGVDPASLDELGRETLGRPTGGSVRARWLEVFPVGSITWSSRYDDAFLRFSEGKRIRLTKHEVLIDILTSRVSSLCWRYQKLKRDPGDGGRMPYMVFRADHTSPAACRALDGCAFTKGRPLLERLVSCLEFECRCHAYRTDDAGIERLRSANIQVLITQLDRSCELKS